MVPARARAREPQRSFRHKAVFKRSIPAERWGGFEFTLVCTRDERGEYLGKTDPA